MDTDDIAPPPRQSDLVARLSAQDLAPFSVAELDARITALEREIVRVRTHRDTSIRHRANAEALFKR